VPAGARGLLCCFNLPARCFGRPSVPGSFGQSHQGDALTTKTCRPVERCTLAGLFFESVAIGRDRLLQPHRPTLAMGHKRPSRALSQVRELL
jgi:hypothetical protein